jgi:hypothetical protein
MRIAVLVYGRLNKCVEHYKNVMESIGESNKIKIDFFFSSDNSPSYLCNDFIRLYKPKLYTNIAVKYDNDLKNIQENLKKLFFMI